MDYKTFVSQVQGLACVLSLTPGNDGERDIIGITAANKAYLDSVGKSNEPFVADRPYTYYIHQDINFEANVKRCITTHTIQHQYVNAGLYSAWLDIFILPLENDSEGIGHCLFTYEISKVADAAKLLGVSTNTAMQVLHTCIQLREAPDYQAGMDSVIKDIRKMCDSSGCSILLTDFEARTCQILCFDSDGSFIMGDKDVVFSHTFYEIAETWRDLMAGSNCYIIANEQDMKEAEKVDKVWTDSLRQSGIHNVVLYPLKVKNKILGYIWATNFNSDKIVFIKEVMELTAFFLSAEIASHKLFEKLEVLGRYDMLTGVLNRNAMNTRVDEWVAGKKISCGDFGIVFVDLNGLKRVNDERGHSAGDDFIKSVAAKIRDVFNGFEIYRAGGDEFMVLASGCPRDDFESLVARLKDQEDIDPAVRFAVGSYYDDSAHDIREAIRLADMSMYRHKSEYYTEHPEFNRRTCE
ncbi:MAG: GGDEF domain-containing protein [Lachnospiraceae bacterium]|nr:GGDEF domain-containing protein [Lachnospiraceae bacterium]MBP5184153.1 GGDEF domain-containing protein [Lachnospiraceae bacterium]